MKASSTRGAIIAGALLAVLAGAVAYLPWVILESLNDFMSPPRRVANVGLLLVILVPLVALFGLYWWKTRKASSEFFASLAGSTVIVFVIVAGIHQSRVTAKFEDTPQGRRETEAAKGAAAWDTVMVPSRVARLKPPLDSYQVAALTNRIHYPDMDGATLHHVLITFPKQFDCEIVQNANVLQADLLAVWKAHNCPESYIVLNPQSPLDVVKAIFEAHPEADPDEKSRTARNQAAVRLAKESCDPKLLYWLFHARGDLAADTEVGLQLRVQMVSNICTPLVVRSEMKKIPDLKQPADYERVYGRLARGNQQAGEAQFWVPPQ